MQNSSEVPEHEKRASVVQFVKDLLFRRGKEATESGKSFEHLPDPLQQYIRAFERDLPARLTDEERAPAVAHFQRMTEFAYLDRRFNMPNRAFSNENVMTELENLMVVLNKEGEGSIDKRLEAAERMAFVAFDLDGLKAVNDITGSHEGGDAYLGLFARILRDGKTVTALKAEGISTVGTVDGGDEFSLFLKSEKTPLTQGKIQSIIAGIQEELSGTLCFACMKMDDERVRAAFVARGLTPPKDYVFRGSVSGDGITVLDALFAGQVKAKEEEGYEDSLRVIAGQLRDIADHRSQDAKVAAKKRWNVGTEEEQFYVKMLEKFRGVSFAEFMAMQRRVQELEAEKKR